MCFVFILDIFIRKPSNKDGVVPVYRNVTFCVNFGTNFKPIKLNTDVSRKGKVNLNYGFSSSLFSEGITVCTNLSVNRIFQNVRITATIWKNNVHSFHCFRVFHPFGNRLCYNRGNDFGFLVSGEGILYTVPANNLYPFSGVSNFEAVFGRDVSQAGGISRNKPLTDTGWTTSPNSFKHRPFYLYGNPSTCTVSNILCISGIANGAFPSVSGTFEDIFGEVFYVFRYNFRFRMDLY